MRALVRADATQEPQEADALHRFLARGESRRAGVADGELGLGRVEREAHGTGGDRRDRAVAELGREQEAALAGLGRVGERPALADEAQAPARIVAGLDDARDAAAAEAQG